MAHNDTKILTSEALPATTISSTQNLLIITDGIKRLLDLNALIISNDAFVRSSRLVIEQKPHVTLKGSVMSDRSSKRPYIVYLNIDTKGCLLKDESGNQERLKNLYCKAIED